MTRRIMIDPITRIEGHLRVDVQVDNNAVSDAWVSGTMWRGIEEILKGRDAREGWLFAQRICGVCTTVHAMASVRAVEDALHLEIPANAQFIRNLILIQHALRDNAMHFYQLSLLDWVDVSKAGQADGAKASAFGERISSWTGNSSAEMKSTQQRIAALANSGQMGLFANGYWGHPAMHLHPDVNLLFLSHYMQAFEFQRKAGQIVAMLGGKTPHIQNLTVGGVSNAINLDSQAVLGMERLESMHSLIGEVTDFIQQVYFPDACMLAGMYPEWLGIGKGLDTYLSLPDLPTDARGTQFDLPGGFIQSGGFSHFDEAEFRQAVTEDVSHSYYKGDKPLHPWKGKTEAQPTEWDASKKYSWVKAARFRNHPVEVGPLAQVLAGYAQGHALTKKWTDLALEQASRAAGHKIGLQQLRSTMGRNLARAIRAAMLADLAQKHWQLLTDNISRGDTAVHNPPSLPSGSVEGVGLHEAPRGALSHWIVIEHGKIANYQAVVPSTWNASPRAADNQRAPYEAALVGTTMHNPEQPLEVLRTIHSFDPCMACACHTFDATGRKLGDSNGR